MIAALLALASAAAYAVATVVGHRAAASTAESVAGQPRRHALPRAVGRLVRRPGFLASQLAGGLGFALHAGALARGLLVVVQPLLCTGMAMALVLGALIDRRHPQRPLPHAREWAAASIVVAGLALFLTSAAPSAGTGTGRPLVLPIVVAAFAALAAAVAGRVCSGRSKRPAVLLGAVAGTGFGLTGVLLKVATTLPLGSWPTAWPVYALVAVGGVATGTAQWSYSAGPLVHSQPVQTALEPVVAVGLAGPVFAEELAGGWPAHTGQAVGLALMVAGVMSGARHAAVAAAAVPGSPGPATRRRLDQRGRCGLV